MGSSCSKPNEPKTPLMWSLRVRGPKGKAAVVQIAPDASMAQLSEMVAPLLSLRSKKNLSFRAGFPPKTLEYSAADLVNTKFTNNDTIVVDVTTAAAAAAAERAAAASSSSGAAAATMAASTGGSKPSTAKRSASAAAAAAAQRPAKRGVHTLHGAATGKRIKRSDRGSGVRLGSSLEENDPNDEDDRNQDDPDDASADADSGARKYRRTRAIHLSSKEDVAVQLVQAVSGGSNDRAAKFFRAATRSAVEHQYAMTLATARLNAALARHFEIHELSTSTTAAARDHAAAVEMRVRFKEGVRKWKEETVEVLQPLELQAILKYVLLSGGETGREMLKPFNMAQCSPRVFWNIARLYNGDVAAGLAALVPDEDFSYVDTRSRQMSKKAMEAQANEAAYKQWKRGGATTATPATPAAQRSSRSQDEVIEIVSDEENEAKENENVKEEVRHRKPTARNHRQAEQRALRDAMAHAAMARFHVSARADDVQAVVRQVAPRPESEDDEDTEPTTTVYCDGCNKARILSISEAAQAQVETADRWTCSLLAGVDGKDASCAALDDEVEQIAGRKLALLLEKAQVVTRRDLADASLPVTLKQLAHPLDATYDALKAKLTAVIEEARLDEVNDAMLEILGGDDALLGTLELLKLGTPADLVETPTDLIVQELCAHEITLEQVQQWQRDAKTRLECATWMGEWRTI